MDVLLLHAGLHVLQERRVRNDKGGHAADDLPLEPGRLHGAAVVHREPRRAPVDDDPLALVLVVQRKVHDVVHVLGRDAPLALQVQHDLVLLQMNEIAGHADIDFLNFSSGRQLRFAHGLHNGLLHLFIRGVPVAVAVSVIGHDAEAQQLRRTGAVPFTHQSHDLGGSKFNGCCHALHLCTTSQPVQDSCLHNLPILFLIILQTFRLEKVCFLSRR